MAATEPRTIRPQEGPQEAFLSSDADIVIYGGQAGSGKTYGLLLETCRHIGVPGFSAVVFRRTYPEIRNPGGLWEESFDIYTGHGRAKEGHLEWRFPKRSLVKFAHMQYEADKYDWDGAQIPLICFDQLEQFTEGQFFYLLGRNRSLVGVRPYVRATCNPVPDDDPTGGWLRKLLAWWINDKTGLPRPERSGLVRWFVRVNEQLEWADRKQALTSKYPDIPPKSLTFIPARLEDNPALMEGDPQYLANLLALPKYERERLREGNWNARPQAGSVFDRAWFRIIGAPPANVLYDVRYWDKAGTEKGGHYSAGVRMSRTPAGQFVVRDVIRGQWSAGKRERIIKQTAELDGQGVAIYVEQEPGSGGKESAENTVRMLAGWVVAAEPATGDRVVKAGPMSSQAEAGNVVLARGEWNEDYLREIHNFPDGAYDDQVTASTGAFNKLVELPLIPVDELDIEPVEGFVL